VATYTPSHREIVETCAEARIPVIYCEKPVANTLSDAEKMVETCKNAGSLLVINHNRRFSRIYRRLRDLLADGLLGEIRTVLLQWGRGRLGNVGTHAFDAVSMLLNSDITAVAGTLDKSGKPDCRGSDFSDPGGWGLLRFSDGLVGTVSAPDYGAQPISFEICGTDGSVLIRGGEVSITMYSGVSPQWDDISDFGEIDPSQTSMDVAVNEIVAWLDTRKTFPYEPKCAIDALEIITAFHVSDRHNSAWIDLPLTGSDRDIYINSG
jgi:predicted dehydrogenase